MRRITRYSIKSIDIVAIPSETVTGKEFRYSNIARVRTNDGGDYDILFDERGEPCADAGLVKRVGDYYGKTFEAVIFDGKAGYAEVRRMPEKTGPKQAMKAAVGGSNPAYSHNDKYK